MSIKIIALAEEIKENLPEEVQKEVGKQQQQFQIEIGYLKVQIQVQGQVVDDFKGEVGQEIETVNTVISRQNEDDIVKLRQVDREMRKVTEELGEVMSELNRIYIRK